MILNIIILVGAGFVLVRSSVLVIESLINLSRIFKLREYILSFVLMSFATTLPDFSLGINAVLSGNPLLALGNVLGANLVTNGLILGFLAVLSGGIVIDKKVAAHDAWLTFALSVAPVFLLLDGRLGRFEGLFLLILFVAYLLKLVRFEEKEIIRHSALLKLVEKNPASYLRSFLKSFFLFVAGAALVLASSYFVVRGMESISDSFGIPDFTLGIFALGLGTSLPELIFGVRSLVVRHSGLSLGNLIGSAALTSTLILGMVAVFSPIEIELNYDFAVVSISMVVVLFLSHLFLRTGSRVNRREGILLLTIYVIFAVLQFLF